MSRTVSLRFSLLGVILATLGALGFTAGVMGDYLRGSPTPGLGLAQVMAMLLGTVSIAQGIALTRAADDQVARWQAAVSAINWASAIRFLTILAQLLLFAAVVRAFRIENPAFYSELVPLTVFGFVLHHALPLPDRLPFFAVLCAGASFLVLGSANALWLLLLVFAFLGLCHLPIAFWLRVSLVIAAAVSLGMLRTGTAPWSGAIWPILGSMLMFRLTVYLYDLRHGRGPTNWAQSVSYFLLLPNILFPLFPVVDFATFRRTYYDRDPYAIYQRGLQWMLRGIMHLIIYRFVYQHLTVSPSDVDGLGTLVRYVVATFLLYLRISGQFHLVIGILHLFGFRLPETHHLFYLSSSFTDLWRRINIYWKEFMMKLVFYPVYFPLRKRGGETRALVVATLAVFAVTWVGHSYQWFWILGRWLYSGTDALFWTILAVLLIANSLYEMKRGRVRIAAGTARGWRPLAAVGLRTAGTFAIVAFLWAFWNSPTLGDWFDLIAIPVPSWQEVGLAAGVLAVIAIAAAVAAAMERRRGIQQSETANGATRLGTAALTFAGLGLLFVTPSVVRLPALSEYESFQEIVRDLRLPNLNQRDQDLLTRGYYEDLVDVSVQNSQLWELFAKRPVGEPSIWQTGLIRETDDFLALVMRPLFGTFHRGQSFKTNRWGMRDQNYERTPGPGTYRIGLLGQSYVAGDGVSDGETFESLVEQRLNNTTFNERHTTVEILNFAVGSYSVFQQLVILDRVFTFQPEAIHFIANSGDGNRASRHLVTQLARGIQPPFAYLRAILDSANVDASTRKAEALRRLEPYQNQMLAWAYREIAAASKRRGILPVWIYLSVPERGPGPQTTQEMADMARAAGFVTLNFDDVYEGLDYDSLRVAPWDRHPNAAGHRVIADRLYQEMIQNVDLGLVHALPRE